MKRDKPAYVLDTTATIHFTKTNLLNLLPHIRNLQTDFSETPTTKLKTHIHPIP